MEHRDAIKRDRDDADEGAGGALPSPTSSSAPSLSSSSAPAPSAFATADAEAVVAADDDAPEWACDACTFVNGFPRAGDSPANCAMCGGELPASAPAGSATLNMALTKRRVSGAAAPEVSKQRAAKRSG